MGRAFGGGMGLGLTCGAVSAAFMVLGYTVGHVEDDDKKARNTAYNQSKEFKRRFEARHNTIQCSGLLHVDMGTKEGHKDAKDRGLFESTCPRLVRCAAEVLEEMIASSSLQQEGSHQ